MNFATTFVADRNKTIYRSTVIPDVIVEEGDNFDELLKDKKIIIALDWFKRNKYD
jgi:tryptophan synthase alpha subunit